MGDNEERRCDVCPACHAERSGVVNMTTGEADTALVATCDDKDRCMREVLRDFIYLFEPLPSRGFRLSGEPDA